MTLDDWDKGFRFYKESKRMHKRIVIQTHKVESSFPLVVNLFKTRNFEGFSNKTVILIIIVTVNITTTNISWVFSVYQAKSEAFSCVISCNPHRNPTIYYCYPHLKDKETEA